MIHVSAVTRHDGAEYLGINTIQTCTETIVWNNRNLDVRGTVIGTKCQNLNSTPCVITVTIFSPNIPKPLVYMFSYLLHWSDNGDDLKLGRNLLSLNV